MKIDELIEDLEHLKSMHGNIRVFIQNNPTQPNGKIVADENVFVVAEPEGGNKLNEWSVYIRNWPY